uniref:Uncharacterized protein n=1 Tax=uncultured organism MedDCM-OCT-S09-C171 TaxID=743644 RepID=D6PJC7_9ZZZZ|nr:hypothetical protein [uncultured organism MedDCM-OCT-S09-C171]
MFYYSNEPQSVDINDLVDAAISRIENLRMDITEAVDHFDGSEYYAQMYLEQNFCT